MGWNRLFFFLAFFISEQAFSQLNIYNVSFVDKSGTAYNLSNPEEFLSQRAVERKARFNIPITEQDLPVSREYLQAIGEYDVSILHTSRWFNSALVVATDSIASLMESETYVSKVELVANNTDIPMNGRMGSSKSGTKRNSSKLKPAAVTNTLQNKMLQVNEMHEMGYTGEGILVAIFDSGFREVDQSSYFDHLHENNQIIFTRDFIGKTENVYQYDTHGTQAFSVMGAYKEDNFVGISYNADFVLCVTENITSEFRVEEYYWAIAAELADSLGVDIINSSLAYSTFDDPEMSYTYEDLDGETTVVTRAANIAAAKGMIITCSVGNDGNKPWKYLNAPADADLILSIGSVDFPNLERSGFSSFGPTFDGRIKPDLCALGVGVRVVKGESIGASNGTSFATPLVAGLSAGFWQAFPELSSYEVMEILKSTASNSEMPDTIIGYGLPNFVDAYDKASDGDEETEETFVVYPNPNDKRKISVRSPSFLEIGTIKVNFADFNGTTIKSMELQVYNSSSDLEIDVSA